MNFNRGDRVRISENLDATINECSATDEMKKMKGKIYTVKSYSPGSNSICISENDKKEWYFAVYDVELYIIDKNLIAEQFKPKKFDIKNLV